MSDFLHFIPLHSPVRLQPFDLFQALQEALEQAQQSLQTGDILIISSKFAAIAEGRVVTLAQVSPSPEAQQLAATYQMSPTVAQVVIDESDHIFGGMTGFVLAVKDNIIAPNAGIDSSNIPEGQVVLYPRESFQTAQQVRQEIQNVFGLAVGVAICDSRLMPARTGTTGVAIGVAGFQPVIDERGKPDLLGRPLKVSQRAVADNLCAAAQLLMGEAAEGIPMVIGRNSGQAMTEALYTWEDMAIDYHDDLYVAIMGRN
jgi:coenzyme F420-0:L-glutamate ligase